MKRMTVLCAIFAAIFMMSLIQASQAQMQSDNYQITTSVMSGGGVPIGSDNYELDSTLGQPSPITDPADPPGSTNYKIYLGFQYTVEADTSVDVDIAAFALSYGSISTDANYNIALDFDWDGDVDGLDLADFLSVFAW